MWRELTGLSGGETQYTRDVVQHGYARLRTRAQVSRRSHYASVIAPR